MLVLDGISKRYGAQLALNQVSIGIRAGEVHGLIGENGSGKTTLLNIISGNPVIRTTGGWTGRMELDGSPVKIRTPYEARSLGIGMVHQEFALFHEFTGAENLFFGREQCNPWIESITGHSLSRISHRRNLAAATRLLEEMGVRADPDAMTGSLSVALKQYVELGREISRPDLRLLILDEPTAAVTPDEAERILSLIRGLARRGVAVLLVTHRLEEVINTCDRVTVLRDGSVTLACERSDPAFHSEQLLHAMLGRELVPTDAAARVLPDDPVLEFDRFTVNMPGDIVHDLTLSVRSGEIMGITGLAGHGRLAVGPGMMGLAEASGQIRFQSKIVTPLKPETWLRSGLYYLPDERRSAGMLAQRSIAENMVFPALHHFRRYLRCPRLGGLSLPDWSRIGKITEEYCTRYDVRCQNPWQPISALSGGNQQKIGVARAALIRPLCLVVSEPTRGIDIGAKQVVLQNLVELNRSQGTTILIVSGELNELRQVCDRIAVMHDGRIRCLLQADAPEASFAAAMV